MSATRSASPIRSALRDSLREHALLVGLVAAYFVGAGIVARTIGVPYQFVPNFGRYAFLLALTLVVAFLWHVVSVLVFVRPERPFRHLKSSLRAYLTAERVLFAAPVLVSVPLFAASFTFVKASIPALNPYSWDPAFTHWDAALHGGVHPWALLHPVLGRPWVTGAIAFSYQLWFVVMYFVVMMQAFDTRRRALRMRLLLSYFICWVAMGTFGAIALSSMGPCFDSALSHNAGPYAPLMSYLHETSNEVPVWALGLQRMLWEDYVQNRIGLGSGISAMPSMHVATMALLALFGWRYSRPAGIALTAFALLIFIGSIHLAWHYAIDGYAGALGAWGVWAAVGWWQRRSALPGGAIKA